MKTLHKKTLAEYSQPQALANAVDSVISALLKGNLFPETVYARIQIDVRYASTTFL